MSQLGGSRAGPRRFVEVTRGRPAREGGRCQDAGTVRVWFNPGQAGPGEPPGPAAAPRIEAGRRRGLTPSVYRRAPSTARGTATPDAYPGSVIGDADWSIRQAAFAWLTDQRETVGEALPRTTLENFSVDGRRIPLMGPQGIWKPAVCELPISITTIVSGPYEDEYDSGRGLLRYAYRGTDPQHRDNRGLRRAMVERVPLVYFHAVEPGRYVAAYPVFVVDDDEHSLFFAMQVDDLRSAIETASGTLSVAEDPEPRRAYVTATFRRRLHQVAFRERVMRAYQERCALCRLRHHELL